MQVEILSGKELTTPPEVSFELLLPEQKPTCGFIVMVRFHTLLRCRKDLFMLYKDFKSTGENLYHPHPCARCGMPNNQKGRMANVIQVVGCPNSTSEAIERLWREVERKLLSSQLWHTKQYQKGNIIYTQR